MRPCDVSERILNAYMDGELKGAQAKEVEAQIESCPDCRDKVARYRAAGDHLREMVDGAVGEVEPLYALQSIRERIAVAEARSPMGRVREWWDNLRMLGGFGRPAVAGMAVALVLGVVSATAMLTVSERDEAPAGPVDGIVLESLQYDGNARAAVYNSDIGETTLIWVEPDPAGKDSWGLRY